jgi:hypothetical protein
MKWQFVDKKSVKARYIVCNADESEPGTFKDHVLMERNPHLLVAYRNLANELERYRVTEPAPRLFDRAKSISEHLAMFSEFLDAAGVPHEGGFVEDEAPTPTKEQLKKAITKIAAKYPPRVVAVYLGLQIFVGGDFVENLGPALDELDWPLTEHLRGEVMTAG